MRNLDKKSLSRKGFLESFQVCTSKVCTSALDNVALNKPAWLSSLIGIRYPYKAVDGKVIETNDDNCVTTDKETSPWWKVDLEGEYKIYYVVISTSGK